MTFKSFSYTLEFLHHSRISAAVHKFESHFEIILTPHNSGNILELQSYLRIFVMFQIFNNIKESVTFYNSSHILENIPEFL